MHPNRLIISEEADDGNFKLQAIHPSTQQPQIVRGGRSKLFSRRHGWKLKGKGIYENWWAYRLIL